MSDGSSGSPGSASRPPAIWDGPALLGAITAATEWLSAHRDRINALNVFPVPDGDTGTNMSLTMRAALDEALEADEATRAGAGGVAGKVAYGALMGARGNSGVILSQIFRGFARPIVDRQEIDGRDLAVALDGARELAYKAVMRPVEGTMLMVIRIAAERAGEAAGRTASLPAVLAEALAGAREALAQTPERLEILRQAGVVDAGGQGVVYILEGMERYARGEVAVAPVEQATSVGEAMEFLDRVEELHGEDAFGYCTNFMVFGEGIDFERSRDELSAMGESAVVVGDEQVLKVHLHTLNPGKVLEYALRIGELDQIKIDNMQIQTRTLAAQRDRRLSPPPTPPPTSPPLGQQAVLAVAAGDGLAEALRSLGATGIIPGGQTMNPSIEELLAGVESAPSDEVILLPNNPNILLTANQVPELTTKRVRVVPTRSVPEGLAALTAYNADADLEANAAAMTSAREGVRTVEITCAVRDIVLRGVQIRAGQVIGLLDDELVASGEDETVVTRETLERADLDDAELITVFRGDGARREDVAALQKAIETAHPHLAVEVHDGGQPHYRYVIAVE